MASFYAELEVAGERYRVWHCTYEFTQATDVRGRAAGKVRHGLVQLELDVPDEDALVDWAATPTKPLPGRVGFTDDQGATMETLSWEAGECVGYREDFVMRDDGTTAYRCFLTIAAARLTITPGTPATPQVALLNAPPLLAPAVAAAEAAAPEVTATAASVLAPLALPAALTLALILATATPAQAPGLPVPPPNPDELRLRELAAKHAAGTLTAAEEQELLDLLAKVKGIRLNSLADLNVAGPLRGGQQALPGFYSITLRYTKRSKADLARLRTQFAPVREKFVKDLANDPSKVARLKQAGLTDDDLVLMRGGNVPTGWQVHHKLPLDDGGTNAMDNLMLIENDPYHLAITNLQNAGTRKMLPGELRVLDWPMYDGYVYP